MYGYDDIYDPNAGKCKEAAAEMVAFLQTKKEKGAVITLAWSPGQGHIWSNIGNKSAGTNGFHVGVLYKGMVYCSVHVTGLSEQSWLNDFEMAWPNEKLSPSYVYF